MEYVTFFCLLITEHCTRSQSAWPGDREFFFTRPNLNVSQLRRLGAIRVQPWKGLFFKRYGKFLFGNNSLHDAS